MEPKNQVADSVSVAKKMYDDLVQAKYFGDDQVEFDSFYSKLQSDSAVTRRLFDDLYNYGYFNEDEQRPEYGDMFQRFESTLMPEVHQLRQAARNNTRTPGEQQLNAAVSRTITVDPMPTTESAFKSAEGVVKGFGAGLVMGAEGSINSMLTGALRLAAASNPVLRTDAVSYALDVDLEQTNRRAQRRYLSGDESELMVNLGSALGSAIPFVAGAMAGGIGSVAALGALAGGESFRQDAIQTIRAQAEQLPEDISPDALLLASQQTINNANLIGYAVGASEALPLGKVSKVFFRNLAADRLLKQSLAGVVAGEALEEGSQEALATIAQNLTAKGLGYDRERAVFENVAESFGYGAFAGAFLQGSLLGVARHWAGKAVQQDMASAIRNVEAVENGTAQATVDENGNIQIVPTDVAEQGGYRPVTAEEINAAAGYKPTEPETSPERIVQQPRNVAEMRVSMMTVFGLNPQQATAVADVYDSVARGWARKNGRKTEDWYAEKIHSMEKLATEESFLQVLKESRDSAKLQTAIPLSVDAARIANAGLRETQLPESFFHNNIAVDQGGMPAVFAKNESGNYVPVPAITPETVEAGMVPVFLKLGRVLRLAPEQAQGGLGDLQNGILQSPYVAQEVKDVIAQLNAPSADRIYAVLQEFGYEGIASGGLAEGATYRVFSEAGSVLPVFEKAAPGQTGSVAGRQFKYTATGAQGMNMAETSGRMVQGMARRLADGRSIIYATTSADVSTPLHELAHIFEYDLDASQRKAVMQWLGVNTWDETTSEMFARGFEKYLSEGSAPNKEMKSMFESFKSWLKDIYHGVISHDGQVVELNSSMRAVYRQILAHDAAAKKSIRYDFGTRRFINPETGTSVEVEGAEATRVFARSLWNDFFRRFPKRNPMDARVQDIAKDTNSPLFIAMNINRMELDPTYAYTVAEISLADGVVMDRAKRQYAGRLVELVRENMDILRGLLDAKYGTTANTKAMLNTHFKWLGEQVTGDVSARQAEVRKQFQLLTGNFDEGALEAFLMTKYAELSSMVKPTAKNTYDVTVAMRNWAIKSGKQLFKKTTGQEYTKKLMDEIIAVEPESWVANEILPDEDGVVVDAEGRVVSIAAVPLHLQGGPRPMPIRFQTKSGATFEQGTLEDLGVATIVTDRKALLNVGFPKTGKASLFAKYLKSAAERGAIRTEQVRDTGVMDWLAGQGEAEISIDQLTQYFKANDIAKGVMVTIVEGGSLSDSDMGTAFKNHIVELANELRNDGVQIGKLTTLIPMDQLSKDIQNAGSALDMMNSLDTSSTYRVLEQDARRGRKKKSAADRMAETLQEYMMMNGFDGYEPVQQQAEIVLGAYAYATGRDENIGAAGVDEYVAELTSAHKQFANMLANKQAAFELIGAELLAGESRDVLDQSIDRTAGGNAAYFVYKNKPYVLAMAYNPELDPTVNEMDPRTTSAWKFMDATNPEVRQVLAKTAVTSLIEVREGDYSPMEYHRVTPKQIGMPQEVFDKMVQLSYATRAVRSMVSWQLEAVDLHKGFDAAFMQKGASRVDVLLRKFNQKEEGLYADAYHYPYLDIHSHLRMYKMQDGSLRIVESQSDLAIKKTSGAVPGAKGVFANPTLNKFHAAVAASYAFRNGVRQIEVPTSSTMKQVHSQMSDSAAKRYDAFAKDLAVFLKEKYQAAYNQFVNRAESMKYYEQLAKIKFDSTIEEGALDDKDLGVWRIELRAPAEAVGHALQIAAEENPVPAGDVIVTGDGTFVTVPNNMTPDGVTIRFQSKMRPVGGPGTPAIQLSGRIPNPKGVSQYDRFMSHWFRAGQEMSLLNDDARNFNALQKDDQRRGRINMHIAKAMDHANALTGALRDYYAVSMLDRVRARFGKKPLAYAQVDPSVSATNTTTIDQFAPGFTRWLKGVRREAMDKLLGTDPSTPAVVFDSRFLHAYRMYANGRAFTPEVQEIFESFTDQYVETLQDKSMLEALNDVLLHKRDIATIPESLQAPVAAMRAHMDQLTKMMIDFGVVTGDFSAVVSDRMGVYMTRSFRIFAEKGYAKRIKGADYENAVNYVYGELLKKDPNATQADAVALVEELIEDKDVEGANTMLYAKGSIGQKDLGILRARGDIPKPIRVLLGEYTDPQTNYMHTVAKVATLVSNHQFLDQLRGEMTGELFFDKSNRPANASVEITAPGLAPLAGMYTYPDVANALNQATQKNRVNSRFIRALLGINAFVKLNKTIFNPVTHIRNPMGGAIMGLASGNLSWPSFQRGLAILTAKPGDPEYAMRMLALEENVIGDDVHVEEVRQYVQEFQDVTDEKSFASAQVRAAARLLAKGANVAAKAYQVEDESMKLMIWLSEKNSLVKYYGMGEAEALKEAARRTHDLYPSYSRASGIVKSLRRNPAIGSFVSFSAESIRVQKNIVKLIGAELFSKDPKRMALGVMRLIGSVAVHGGVVAVGAMSSAWVFGGDDEKEKDARRNIAPWSANSDIFWLENTEEGLVKYIDLSFNDPFATWKKPIMLLTNKDRDRTVMQFAKDAAWEAFKPYIAPEIFVQAIMETVANQRFTYGGKVVSETDPMYEVKLMAHIAKEFVPGAVSDVVAVKRAIAGEPENFYGKVPSLGDELMEKVGLKQTTINLRVPLSVKTRKNLRLLQDVSGSWNSSMLDQRNLQDSEFDASRNYEEHAARYRKVQDEIIKDVASVRSLGVSYYSAEQVLIASGMKPKQARDMVVGYREPLPRSIGKIIDKRVRNQGLYGRFEQD